MVSQVSDIRQKAFRSKEKDNEVSFERNFFQRKSLKYFLLFFHVLIFRVHHGLLPTAALYSTMLLQVRTLNGLRNEVLYQYIVC